MLDKIKRNIADKVIEENLDYLIRFAFFRLQDMPMAEDVVHGAILKFIDNTPSILNTGKFKSYLFRMVYNGCQDCLRTGKLRIKLDSIDEPACDDEAEQDIEDAVRIGELLGRLPDKEAEIVRMRTVDELSFVEISRILSIPATTAKSRFKNGINKLRKDLSTYKMS